MKIRKLTLYTNEFQAQKSFYIGRKVHYKVN